MGKARDYTAFETMLPQGARSRFDKTLKAMDAADELMPDSAMEGTAADLRGAIAHLQTATANLIELLVYRKMTGVD